MKRKAITKQLRVKVWGKYNHHCAYCGCGIAYSDMQIDHIIPHYRYSDVHGCLIGEFGKVDYGINDFKNLNPACRICNKWKSTWSLDEFRSEIKMQIERLQERSAGFRLALKFDLIQVTKQYEAIEFTDKKLKFYFEV